MIFFVDTNIFLYAIGPVFQFQGPSKTFLREVVEERYRAVTSTEVFQEVLHQCDGKGRRARGIEGIRDFRSFLQEVLPVTDADIQSAETLISQYPSLKIRDAIHVAVMKNHGIFDLVSYDKDFDVIKDIQRVEPPDVSDQFLVQETTDRYHGRKVKKISLVEGSRRSRL